MSITVRPAGMSDIPELSRVLGVAFADDPIISWLIPDDAARSRRAASLFAAQARHHFLRAGGVEVACDESGKIGGATLWAPPGQWHASDLTTLRQLPGLLRAFRGRIGAA